MWNPPRHFFFLSKGVERCVFLDVERKASALIVRLKGLIPNEIFAFDLINEMQKFTKSIYKGVIRITELLNQ